MGQEPDEIGRLRQHAEDAEEVRTDYGSTPRDRGSRFAEFDNQSSDEIRREIVETRAEMAETIDAIQDRLNPQRLRAQATGAVREATLGRAQRMMDDARENAREASGGILQTIMDNPIPAAMVGLGLGWMLANRSSGSPRRRYGRYDYEENEPTRYGTDSPARRSAELRDQATGKAREFTGMASDRVADVRQAADEARHAASERVEEIRETAGERAAEARDMASERIGVVKEQAQAAAEQAAEFIGETGTQVSRETQRQFRRVEDRFQETLQTNPLALGVVALGIGAVVGMALPETNREDEMLGETRDRLMQRAQEAAGSTMERVQRVATEAQHAATEAARREAENQGLYQ